MVLVVNCTEVLLFGAQIYWLRGLRYQLRPAAFADEKR